MFNVMRILVVLVGPFIGYFFVEKTYVGMLIGLGLSAIIISIEILIEMIKLDVLVFGLIGAAIGLFFAWLVRFLSYRIDNPLLFSFVDRFSALITVFLIVLGVMIAIRKKGELDLLDKDIVVRGKKNKDIKILDTCVLIDGRIADIVETGFLSGKFIVPRFVLHELQMVADSSDTTKRQRGRRGMDILKRLQEVPDITIKIYDRDFSHIKEVDSKLLELAKELGAKVATTDYNLNKVAALQGISVLNVNDLAGALKPVVLPGDSLTIFLVKEGKEKAQAVGYLDDGTMIVVDEARKHIGKRVGVLVNSILQTSAGRMIFARLQEGREAEVEVKPPSIPEITHPPSA
ncbi:MAG: PIN domain nuclease [Elusimicrobia bacterium]|nr:PIN domain nuclease [Candidatus Obscuribacterium magneticum]